MLRLVLLVLGSESSLFFSEVQVLYEHFISFKFSTISQLWLIILHHSVAYVLEDTFYMVRVQQNTIKFVCYLLVSWLGGWFGLMCFWFCFVFFLCLINSFPNLVCVQLLVIVSILTFIIKKINLNSFPQAHAFHI